jgi:hypothetical protein
VIVSRLLAAATLLGWVATGIALAAASILAAGFLAGVTFAFVFPAVRRRVAAAGGVAPEDLSRPAGVRIPITTETVGPLDASMRALVASFERAGIAVPAIAREPIGPGLAGSVQHARALMALGDEVTKRQVEAERARRRRAAGLN